MTLHRVALLLELRHVRISHKQMYVPMQYLPLPQEQRLPGGAPDDCLLHQECPLALTFRTRERLELPREPQIAKVLPALIAGASIMVLPLRYGSKSVYCGRRELCR